MGILVSIIVPIYNGEDVIDNCINSIVKSAKNYPTIQLIVIDDGSKDRSIEKVIRILNETNIRFEIIRHDKNLGIAATLNEGFHLAEGDYVLIIHQDCEICDDNYIIALLNTLFKNSNVAVACGRPVFPVNEFKFFDKVFFLVNNCNRVKQQSSLEEISFTEHKCDLFRKDLFFKVGGFNSIYFRYSAEDQELSWRIHKMGYKIIRNNNVRYIQRYGKSIKSISGIVKKLLKYGKTQAEVILATHGDILDGKYSTSDQKIRKRNRLYSIISGGILNLLGFFWVLFPNIICVSFILGILIIRSLYFVSQAVKNEPYLLQADLLFAGLLAAVVELSYFYGFCYGSLVYLVKNWYKTY